MDWKELVASSNKFGTYSDAQTWDKANSCANQNQENK